MQQQIKLELRTENCEEKMNQKRKKTKNLRKKYFVSQAIERLAQQRTYTIYKTFSRYNNNTICIANQTTTDALRLKKLIHISPHKRFLHDCILWGSI